MKAHELARLLLEMPDVDVVIPDWVGGTYDDDIQVELREDLHVDRDGVVYNDDDQERRHERDLGHSTPTAVTKIVIY